VDEVLLYSQGVDQGIEFKEKMGGAWGYVMRQGVFRAKSRRGPGDDAPGRCLLGLKYFYRLIPINLVKLIKGR
jgi:hypothetical protein